MRNFVCNSYKGGRCNSFIQKYESEVSDEVFIIISIKLKINGKIGELLEMYSEFSIKYEKVYAKYLNSIYRVL